MKNLEREVNRFPEVNMILDEGAFEPFRGHDDDAGLDLRAPKDIIIPAHSSAVCDFGIHFEIPSGWFGKLESKSGLNVNHQIFCGGGIIDSGFTGSIKARLYNFSGEDYEFKAGDKFVQIVFIPISIPRLIKVKEFGEHERGDSGWGSTGR